MLTLAIVVGLATTSCTDETYDELKVGEPLSEKQKVANFDGDGDGGEGGDGTHTPPPN